MLISVGSLHSFFSALQSKSWGKRSFLRIDFKNFEFLPHTLLKSAKMLAVLYTDSFSPGKVLKETERFLNLPLEYSAMSLGWPLESWGREHSPIGQGEDFTTKSPRALTVSYTVFLLRATTRAVVLGQLYLLFMRAEDHPEVLHIPSARKNSVRKIILEQESQLLEFHMGISGVWGNWIHKTHFELKLCGKQFTLLKAEKNNSDFCSSSGSWDTQFIIILLVFA